MMPREERAKQFIPFDAMKGLREALSLKDEKHSRVKRHGISDEQKAENSKIILRLKKNDYISIFCYQGFHDKYISGRISEINLDFKYINIDGIKIGFEDIYAISYSLI